MGQYDNYNPDIPYGNQDVPPIETPQVTPRTKRSGTAKNQQTRNVGRAGAKGKMPAEKKESIFLRIKNWATSSTPRIIAGVFLGCLGIYLLVCFISYLSECIHDQSLIDGTAVGTAKGVANAGGEGGARLSEFLINKSFGVGSIVIVGWLIAMSLKLLAGRPHFKSVNFTIKCFVALITLSMIVGLSSIAVESTVNWGGYDGRYVNEFIIHFVGWIGALLLSVFLLACFIVICLRDVVNWAIRLRNERREHRRMLREERERQLEKERNLEEMRKREEADTEVAGDLQNSEEENVMDAIPVSFDALGYYPDIDDTEQEEINLENDSAYKAGEDVNSSEEDIPGDGDVVTEPDGEKDSEKYGSAEPEVNPDNQEDVPTENNDDADDTADDTMVVNVNQPSLMDKPLQRKATGGPNPVPYKFPPFSLLNPAVEDIFVDPEEQQQNKDKIKKTLADYGIPIVSISATVGPTVTLYEIVPDRGVRTNKIRQLVDDIALSLAAIGVRIIAPIPGRGTVGIEVANKDPKTVSMQTVIKSRKFQETKFKLPIALGATINNDIYMADLTKMPHLLVAGATGQGKSVGLNAIITSLLYKKTPNELKFVLIDPKMVEFSIYDKIERHYLAKIPNVENSIITDMVNDVVPTLSSLCIEMDARYNLLSGVARNIEEYNEKWLSGRLDPEQGHKFLPYIVVIADEFADMLMVSGKDVELPIARLAQKARAVGIHVILATQRPSADIITGKIKANFPARIAFRVSSAVDSKTILDTTGAQQLIGRGDMLISHNSEIVRVQCAFVDTPEVESICEHVSRQAYGIGPFLLPEPMEASGGGDISAAGGEIDSMLPDAARLVVSSNTASISNIQRKLSIGYNRAGRIMDQLERLGVVSASFDNKPRSVLMDINSLEKMLANL